MDSDYPANQSSFAVRILMTGDRSKGEIYSRGSFRISAIAESVAAGRWFGNTLQPTAGARAGRRYRSQISGFFPILRLELAGPQGSRGPLAGVSSQYPSTMPGRIGHRSLFCYGNTLQRRPIGGLPDRGRGWAIRTDVLVTLQRPRLRRRLAAVRPGDLRVPCLDLFMKTPWHSSLQNRCASALSSLPQASHLAIAKLLTDQVRSFALSVPATSAASSSGPAGRDAA